MVSSSTELIKAPVAIAGWPSCNVVVRIVDHSIRVPTVMLCSRGVDGHAGNPWCLSCDNAVCVKLWVSLICFFGTAVAIVFCAVDAPLFLAYLGAVMLVALVVSLVLMLLSCRACWVKPAYQSLIDTGGTLLTPETEAVSGCGFFSYSTLLGYTY